MKPVDMGSFEYYVKFTAATSCFVCMVLIIISFLFFLLTQFIFTGVSPRFYADGPGVHLMDAFVVIGVLFISLISINSLYIRSRRLFIELGFAVEGFIFILKKDIKELKEGGFGQSSSIQSNRDYLWLSFIMICAAVFFFFSLSFFPDWVAFILFAGICNVSSRRI